MKKLLICFAMISVLTVVGYAQAKTAPILDKLEAEFVAAFNAKDAAKVASFYAEDAILMPPGAPLVKGRAAIQAFYGKAFAANVGTVKLSRLESEITGAGGFAAGTYTLTVAKGTSMTLTGVGGSGTQVSNHKYLTIFKSIGKEWKIAFDMQNADQ